MNVWYKCICTEGWSGDTCTEGEEQTNPAADLGPLVSATIVGIILVVFLIIAVVFWRKRSAQRRKQSATSNTISTTAANEPVVQFDNDVGLYETITYSTDGPNNFSAVNTLQLPNNVDGDLYMPAADSGAYNLADETNTYATADYEDIGKSDGQATSAAPERPKSENFYFDPMTHQDQANEESVYEGIDDGTLPRQNQNDQYMSFEDQSGLSGINDIYEAPFN